MNIDERIEFDHIVEEYRYSSEDERENIRRSVERQIKFNKALLKTFDKIDRR